MSTTIDIKDLKFGINFPLRDALAAVTGHDVESKEVDPNQDGYLEFHEPFLRRIGAQGFMALQNKLYYRNLITMRRTEAAVRAVYRFVKPAFKNPTLVQRLILNIDEIAGELSSETIEKLPRLLEVGFFNFQNIKDFYAAIFQAMGRTQAALETTDLIIDSFVTEGQLRISPWFLAATLQLLSNQTSSDYFSKAVQAFPEVYFLFISCGLNEESLIQAHFEQTIPHTTNEMTVFLFEVVYPQVLLVFRDGYGRQGEKLNQSLTLLEQNSEEAIIWAMWVLPEFYKLGLQDISKIGPLVLEVYRLDPEHVKINLENVVKIAPRFFTLGYDESGILEFLQKLAEITKAQFPEALSLVVVLIEAEVTDLEEILGFIQYIFLAPSPLSQNICLALSVSVLSFSNLGEEFRGEKLILYLKALLFASDEAAVFAVEFAPQFIKAGFTDPQMVGHWICGVSELAKDEKNARDIIGRKLIGAAREMLAYGLTFEQIDTIFRKIFLYSSEKTESIRRIWQSSHQNSHVRYHPNSNSDYQLSMSLVYLESFFKRLGKTEQKDSVIINDVLLSVLDKSKKNPREAVEYLNDSFFNMEKGGVKTLKVWRQCVLDVLQNVPEQESSVTRLKTLSILASLFEGGHLRDTKRFMAWTIRVATEKPWPLFTTEFGDFGHTIRRSKTSQQMSYGGTLSNVVYLMKRIGIVYQGWAEDFLKFLFELQQRKKKPDPGEILAQICIGGVKIHSRKELDALKLKLARICDYSLGSYSRLPRLLESIQYYCQSPYWQSYPKELALDFNVYVENWIISDKRERINEFAVLLNDYHIGETDQAGQDTVLDGVSRRLSPKAAYFLISFGGAALYTSTFQEIWSAQRVRNVRQWLDQVDPEGLAVPDFLLNMSNHSQVALFRQDTSYFLEQVEKIIFSGDDPVNRTSLLLPLLDVLLDGASDDDKRRFGTFLDRSSQQKERPEVARSAEFLLQHYQEQLQLSQQDRSLSRRVASLPRLSRSMIPHHRWLRDQILSAKLYFYPDEEWFAVTDEMYRSRGWRRDRDYMRDRGLDPEKYRVVKREVNGVTLRIVMTMASDEEDKRSDAINGNEFEIIGHRGHIFHMDETFPLGTKSSSSEKLLFGGACGSFQIMMQKSFLEVYGKHYFIADDDLGEGAVNTRLLDEFMIKMATGECVDTQGNSDWTCLDRYRELGFVLPDDPRFRIKDYVNR